MFDVILTFILIALSVFWGVLAAGWLFTEMYGSFFLSLGLWGWFLIQGCTILRNHMLLKEGLNG